MNGEREAVRRCSWAGAGPEESLPCSGREAVSADVSAVSDLSLSDVTLVDETDARTGSYVGEPIGASDRETAVSDPLRRFRDVPVSIGFRAGDVDLGEMATVRPQRRDSAHERRE